VGALALISIIAMRWMPETAPRRLGGREYADWTTTDTNGKAA
jgi:hypothetical protein